MRVVPGEFADWLMARGQHFINSDAAATVLGVTPDAVPDSLERARESGKIISVTKSAWVPVPPEYRAAGAPPVIHFIDPLMRHLGHPYYVGFLSAAAIHGAGHQASMVLQVVTSARLRDRAIGHGRVQFVRRADTAQRPTQQHNVPTGRVTVSTPATTVLDLVGFPRAGAGLSNIATVIGDLLIEGKLNTAELTDAARRYPIAVVQRAGYLIDLMTTETDTVLDLAELRQLIATADFTRLSPDRPATDERDDRWRVLLNTAIEHDL